MSTRAKAILPVIVVIGAVGCAAVLIALRREVKPQPVEVLPPLVRVVEARHANHQFTIHSQGTVMPRRDIQLVAEVAGRVVEMSPSLAAGGFFQEGDTLVRIDPRDYELARIRATAQVREAEVRLTREKAEAEVARKEWKELGKGEPSPLLLREPQLAEAQAAMEAARAALEQAELDLERTAIQAPFDGRVWEKRVDLGQYLAKGAVLGRLYSVDVAEVRLPLPVEELAFLNLPLSYQAEADAPGAPTAYLRGSIAGGEQVWTGQVVRTEAEIDPRTRMATVVARVADPYHRQTKGSYPPLAVGLFVQAEIAGRTATNVFVLPRLALRGRDRVIVVDNEDRLRFREVAVLKTDREKAVIASGIDDGERVSVSLLDAPVDGMKVRVLAGEDGGQ